MNLNSNFYLIEKPKSWTSQDLCTKFKKTYKFKKVGHSGTLDPNAEGLMLVATNSFTKLFDYIGNTNKTYYVKAFVSFIVVSISISLYLSLFVYILCLVSLFQSFSHWISISILKAIFIETPKNIDVIFCQYGYFWSVDNVFLRTN